MKAKFYKILYMMMKEETPTLFTLSSFAPPAQQFMS